MKLKNYRVCEFGCFVMIKVIIFVFMLTAVLGAEAIEPERPPYMIYLTDFIEREILKKILLISILTLAVISLINWTVFVLHKIYIEKRKEKLKMLEDYFLKNVFLSFFLTQKIPQFQLKTSLEFEAFSNCINSIINNITGNLLLLTPELLKKSGLIEHYKKLSNSKNYLIRLEAYERLGFLKRYELKDFFIKKLEKEDNYYIKMQLLWNLSLIANEDLLKTIINTLNKDFETLSLKFVEALFFNIINSLINSANESEYIKILEEIYQDTTIKQDIIKSMIEVCGYAQVYQAKDVILKYYKTYNSLKTVCFRALGKLKIPEVCEMMPDAFNDESWVLRATAVRYSYLCENRWSILEKALHDLNFNIRKSAAKVLYDLGERALIFIQNTINQTTDRYAKEVAEFVLRKILKNV